MTTPLRFRSILLAGLFYLGLNSPAWADAILDQGRQLLDAGDAQAAYALLEPLEAERMGEPNFDFLLGLAALDAGKNTRAVFALERVLALQPGNARARAEIARAYLQMGERRAARDEFEKVKLQDIPQDVSATIDRLLAMIQRAENRDKPQLKGFLDLTVGNDSNVNSSTDATTVAVPALGIATLNPNSVQTGDTFATLAGGLSYRYPIGAGHFATGNLAASGRRNDHDSQFDTHSLDGALGWQFARGKTTLNVALTGSKFERDGDDLRDTIGLNAQWQHDYDAIRQATLFGQYLDISYPGQTIRDVDRFVVGAGYAEAVRSRTVVFGSLYGGQEREKAANVRHLGHTLGGLRLGSQHRFDDQWSMLASLGYENRRYGDIEPLFDDRRTDHQVEAALGVNWQFSPEWRLGLRGTWVENESNIPVFDYRRDVYSMNLHFDF